MGYFFIRTLISKGEINSVSSRLYFDFLFKGVNLLTVNDIRIFFFDINFILLGSDYIIRIRLINNLNIDGKVGNVFVALFIINKASQYNISCNIDFRISLIVD